MNGIENHVWEAEFDKLKEESYYINFIKENSSKELGVKLLGSLVIDVSKYVHGNMIEKYQICGNYLRPRRVGTKEEFGLLFISNDFLHKAVEIKRSIDSDISYLLSEHIADSRVVASRYLIHSIKEITPYVIKSVSSIEQRDITIGFSSDIKDIYAMVSDLHNSIIKSSGGNGARGAEIPPSRKI